MRKSIKTPEKLYQSPYMHLCAVGLDMSALFTFLSQNQEGTKVVNRRNNRIFEDNCIASIRQLYFRLD